MRIFIFERGLSHAPTEYSQYLIYPYNAEYSHDNALGAASVTLRNMEREETFAPGTVVMIGDGSWKDNTCDQWVIVNTARGTNHANGKHTHTLYLSDLTKLLERDVIGNKTFTRSIVLGDISESKTFSTNVTDTNSDYNGSNVINTAFYCTTLSYSSPQFGKSISLSKFSNVFPYYNGETGQAERTDEISVTAKLNGKIIRRSKYIVGTNYSEGTAENQTGDVITRTIMSLADWISQSGISVEFDGFGTVEIMWRVKRIKSADNTRTVYMSYYLADSSNAPEKQQKTLLEACQILANIADGSRYLTSCIVRPIGQIAERAMAQEITDIDITGANLREATDTVAGVGGCFCRYRIEYEPVIEEFEHYIDIYPISSREKADLAPLGSPVVRKMEDSIEGACSEMDSNVSNLVTLSDSGTICEPTDEAWTSLRSEDVRITEESAEIPTSFPIYRIEKLEVRYKQYTADITKYVVEKTAYDLLSSFAPAYPRSKAYALYYQRGQANIGGLSFEQQSAISQLLVSPAIVNICNAEFGTSYTDLGMKSGTLYYPDLQFRITYVPIVEARVRQAKPDATDNTSPNVIFYNQSASYVDSVRYGRNLAGATERGGQPGKTLIYKVSNSAKLPKPGQLYDEDYTISKISIQRGKDMQTVQLNLARYYNRLNPFIGIDSAPRLFEISELGYTPRNIVYEDYCIIGDVQSGGVKGIVTADGLNGFALGMMSGGSRGKYSPVIAIVQGESAVAGELAKCALPITSFGLGRSLVFAFAYKDNFSAGDKAIEAEEYTDLYRLKEAVPYADDFGEIEKITVVMADASNTDTFSPDDLPEDVSSNTYREIFRLDDHFVWKDSREQIKFTYQVHFVNNKGWIISPGMAEDFRMVTRKTSYLSRAVRLYRLSYELSRVDTKIDLTRATAEKYTYSAGSTNTIPLKANATAKTVEMMEGMFTTYAAQNRFTGDGVAWAVAYDDGTLLFGNNEPITASTSLPNINFSFRHNIPA